MQSQATPLVDYDEAAQRITVARVLLERAYGDLERLEQDVPARFRGELFEASKLVALALEELPAN